MCWLWGAATTNFEAFVIHGQSGVAGLTTLLGKNIRGILHIDRWHAYRQVPEERRQLCWAHLKRDFRKIVEGGGPSEFVGRRGLRLVRELFVAWQAFRAGTIDRACLRALIAPLERCLNKTLLQGALAGEERIAKF
ncbi:IS66 family transposase [Telmatocola sphagniphila]|uniref:IS66 family transposase n=1 Tax=Telmatocola sphagniphila TaxID=1123043 RepID=UPI0036F232D1